jgi:hypothetical protein
MRYSILGLLTLLGAQFALACLAFGAEGMTNQDVIKMVRAKLPEKTIVMTIESANPNFDTSADGVIKLTSSGVPNAVVQAVIKAQSGDKDASMSVSVASGTPGPHLNKGAFDPEEVILVEGDRQSAMKYLVPTTRSGARALGFGGFASYAVLHGTSAHQRAQTNRPSFIVEVPERSQPESYVTVANLAVRKNGTREIMVAGGYMTMESGIAHDRIVAIDSEKLTDQSRAQSGFVLYKVTPSQPLPAGEYAVVLYNSAVPVAGYFSNVSASYFDFGVNG